VGNPSNNRLKAATYGRGLWESDLYTPAVPANITLQNILLLSGESRCDDATQTITVTNFVVAAGGAATMIAGQRINYLPNTNIHPGGYLHGYITTIGQYCPTPPSPPVENTALLAGDPEDILYSGDIGNLMFKVYPNPTTGTFILEFKEIPEDAVEMEVYGMQGEKALSETLPRTKRHEFSLSGRPAGLYFIRVVSEGQTGTQKIIKQ